MAQPLDSLDLHFRLPTVNKVGLTRPFVWLRLGWDDIRANPAASLSYGGVLAALGVFILGISAEHPHLLTAAVVGFLILGPLMSAGLYEISRRRGLGLDSTIADAFGGIRRHAGSLGVFGLMLGLAALAWERLSAVLFALTVPGPASDLKSFLSGRYTAFIVNALALGLFVVALVFALTAFAIPRILHRDTDVVTAAMTSLRAVSSNLSTMALWALIIMTLMAVGLATWMIGMVFVVPLLGHATWHAYTDVIADPDH
jgi:uncharacterized membrane protein